MRWRECSLGVLMMVAGCAQADPDTRDEGVRSCPAIGCASVVEVRVETALAPDEASSGLFTACRNDDCSQLVLSGSTRMVPDDRPPALTPEEHEMRAQEGNGAVLSRKVDSDPVELLLMWRSVPDETDSDRYRLSVELSDGSTVELLDETIEYHEKSVLEGTSCELTCRVGKLEVSAP